MRISAIAFVAICFVVAAGCETAQQPAMPGGVPDVAASPTQSAARSIGAFQTYDGPATILGHEMTVTPSGDVWFRDEHHKMIGFITNAGVVREFHLPKYFSFPIGIATGADGDVWYTATGASLIGRVSPHGAVSTFGVGMGREPFQIVAGPDGDLWFDADLAATPAWSICKMTMSGKDTCFKVPQTDSTELVDIAVGPDGDVWFADLGDDLVGRVSPHGDIAVFSTPSGDAPARLASARDGDIYATVVGGGLLRITKNGAMRLVDDRDNGEAFDEITEGSDGDLWGSRYCADGVTGCLTRYDVAKHAFADYPLPADYTLIGALVGTRDGRIWYQVRRSGLVKNGVGVFAP